MAEEASAVPASQKSSFSSFLKQLASFSGDLSSITAPSFILSPTSLAEFPSYWGEPIEHFLAIPKGKTPEERQLLVTKWFIATLAPQFLTRQNATGSEKKPLNPILGEQFFGTYADGDTHLTVEQTSHHPPVSSYYLVNDKLGVSLEGHCGQKTSFSGRTIVVKQVGHAIVRVKVDGSSEPEKYLITLPKLYIEGLWYGAPYIELNETSYIQASHGLTTTINYKGKGWVSGKAHSFSALIGTGPSPKSPAYTIEGTWNGHSEFAKGSKNAGQPFVDCSQKHEPVKVKPIEQQGEWESRRIWKDVADGIRKGDFESAGTAKSKIENAQRQARKDEAAKGETWKPRLFDHLPEDPDYTQLASMCKHSPATEEGYKCKSRQ